MDRDGWSADDFGRIARDMLTENFRAYFEAEDQVWEEARLTTLKSQGKLITGRVINNDTEIERGEF
jgi:hypothetical protein